MSIGIVILICVFVADLFYVIGKNTGSKPQPPPSTDTYMWMFCLSVAPCVVMAAERNEYDYGKAIARLAEILKPFTERKKCLVEILPELMAFENELKGKQA